MMCRPSGKNAASVAIGSTGPLSVSGLGRSARSRSGAAYTDPPKMPLLMTYSRPVAGSAISDSASRGPSGKTSSYDGTSTSRFPRPTGTRATETDGRSARLSPMSPTQTSLPPAGARASTSTGSADHCVTPTVSPVAGSTVKTRPESPESLVVTSSPSTRASPLDSTISGSSNRVTSLPASRAPGRNAATTNGIAVIPSRYRSRMGAPGEELGQPGLDPPRRDQVVVLPPHGTSRDRAARPHRAQQRVAR